MWNKINEYGFFLWVPENYIFKQKLCIFGNIDKLDEFIDKLDDYTIVIYENLKNCDFDYFELKFPNIIVAISIFQNRYAKPYTGGFEYIVEMAKKNNSEFDMGASMIISNNIGIIGTNKNCGAPSRKYTKCIDRAFGHNIGIENIYPLSIFNDGYDKIVWSWSTNNLPIIGRDKLFHGEIEPLFKTFIFNEVVNIIFITGPPLSGKSILAFRISKILECDIIDKQTPFDEYIENYFVFEVKKSVIVICQSPEQKDKNKIIELFNQINSLNKTPINYVWIEMATTRKVVEFLRHLKVQMAKTNNLVIRPYSEIREYYDKLDFKDIDKPKYITFIRFPLVLKKIKELNYIF